jgi:hypothetical protein
MVRTQWCARPMDLTLRHASATLPRSQPANTGICRRQTLKRARDRDQSRLGTKVV